MQWERPQQLFARTALTDKGWQNDVLIGIDAAGNITTVKADSNVPAGVPSFNIMLPGMPNVHSHAFQRAMAGLTEKSSGKHDNFWSWREAMYRFTRNLTPEQTEATARALYIELLKQGYTSVGEFHYLHHDINGKPYPNPAELSDRIISAAQHAGIHLTHLPVLYETSNFGGIPAHEGQQRFVLSVEDYLSLLATLKQRYANTQGITLGVAPHSLRAVTPTSLQRVLEALPSLGMAGCPIHIHVAEQEKEVTDCMAWSSQRPVEWLLNHAPVDARWCLVHATHVTPDEITRMAASNAVVGLCPTTEANLGDGIFPTEAYLKAGGRFGIGSDSNICVSPWEELRMLEYSQRLSLRKRNILCDDATPSVGRNIFTRAVKGGAQALGIKSGCIAAGHRADLIALPATEALLLGKEGDDILDTLIFAVNSPAISDVFVAGKHVVADGRHPLEQQ